MRPLTLLLGSAWLLGTVGASAIAIQGCGSSSCEESQTCGAVAGDGGVGEGGDGPAIIEGGADGLPPGCDGTKDPGEASCQVVDEVGIFVDSTAGAGDGTKGKPVTTIAKGIELAKAASKGRVYVCKGTYAEAVVLDASKDGVSIYGGFKCADWSYAKEATLVAPPTVGFALTIKKTAAAITIADLEFRAKAAEADGDSSIAGFVSDASSVTLKRVKLVAAAGKDGKSGASVADFAGRAPDGMSAIGTTPGAPAPNTCTTGNSTGGLGGSNNQGGASGTPLGLPEIPPLATGTGGDTNQPCASSFAAHDGAFGPGGAPGNGAAQPGHLTASEWAHADGSSGGNGGTAQGGGGGAGKSGYGGGGGAGGCGGLAGAGGTGGGSSIALASFRSAVSITASAFTAENGRDGGKGASGQKGQLGSLSTGNGVAGGCSGGLGGHGGSGGGGGGGAGGSSIGIAYQGTAPTVDGAPIADAATLVGVTIGSAGGKGLKGTGGPAAQTAAPASNAGLDGTDGAPGLAKAVTAVP
ncbi:MAG: Glycine-rich cell wall structural protein precursor [Myxococcaceae bacterium]|nr:Glycine-rich cell wall structural protein precursor [Myxococcaceae bacterium]